MSGFRRTFFKTGQILDSTFRDSKKHYDEDYVLQDRCFENLRKLMAELKMLFEKTIEPRSKARARISGNGRKPVSKDSKECPLEIVLEDFLYKNSGLVESPTRDAFVCLEKFYHRVADARERLEVSYVDNTKNTFKDTVEAPAEEIKFMAKKVESKRIELQALKADKKTPVANITTAQEAFDDIRIHRQNLMIDFTQNSHKEYVSLLAEYMGAWESFFRECYEVASSTHSTLNELYKHSVNKPLVPHLKSGSTNVRMPQPFENDNQYNEPQSPLTTNPNFDQSPFGGGDEIHVQNSNPFGAPPMSIQANSATVAEVLFDFEAEAPEELTCYAGNKVVIIERIDENWYNCSLDGKYGFVPVNYLKILK